MCSLLIPDSKFIDPRCLQKQFENLAYDNEALKVYNSWMSCIDALTYKKNAINVLANGKYNHRKKEFDKMVNCKISKSVSNFKQNDDVNFMSAVYLQLHMAVNQLFEKSDNLYEFDSSMDNYKINTIICIISHFSYLKHSSYAIELRKKMVNSIDSFKQSLVSECNAIIQKYK